jgi:hypothetical protein
MRILVLGLLLLIDAAAQSVSSATAQRVTSATFAQLSTAPNGSVRYCTNCTQASPCASGGTGALAVRRAGAWDCGSGLPAGCSAVSGVLTCPGGYASGDGTAVAKWEIPELSANGLNKQVIFGPSSIAADGCVIWPSVAPGANQVLGDLGSSLTVEGLPCRVLGWVDASVSGCSAVSGVLTCPGGYASGDGTAVAKWEIPELSANGVNKQVIFGPSSIAADGCVVWPSVAPTSGQVLVDSGATSTIEGLPCRVLSWGAGGGSNATVAATDPPGSCTAPSFWMNSATARAWYCADGTYSPIGEMNIGTAAPGACVVLGSLYYRSSTGALHICNGSSFVAITGGGGAPALTAGSCFLTTFCAPPLAGVAAVVPGNGYSTPTPVVLRVHVIQVVLPYSATFTQFGVRAAGGGSSATRMGLGVYDNSGNAPGALLGGCTITDVTSGGAWRTCSTSVTITAGVPVWFAVAVEDLAMSVRGFSGEFSNAFTEFATLLSPSRSGFCANLATAGGSFTLPASCGALTSKPWPVPMVLAVP